ncbi:MAG: hypothetical protein H0U59_13150 [Gemmatimonadaceae bacterium]|nr:hypothetical protein [Gemmatimonadaceae bacterium]
MPSTPSIFGFRTTTPSGADHDHDYSQAPSSQPSQRVSLSVGFARLVLQAAHQRAAKGTLTPSWVAAAGRVCGARIEERIVIEHKADLIEQWLGGTGVPENYPAASVLTALSLACDDAIVTEKTVWIEKNRELFFAKREHVEGRVLKNLVEA